MDSEKYKALSYWCRSEPPKAVGNNLNWSRNNATSPAFDQHLKEVAAGIKKGMAGSWQISEAIPAGIFHLNVDMCSQDFVLSNLSIGNPGPLGVLVIRGIRVWNVSLYWQGSTPHTDPIVFENCEIANLNMHHDSRVSLKNTSVGNLIITKAHQIHMQGGCVLNIQIPAPGNETPLTGSVSFSNTFFPRKRGQYLLSGSQPYRNMRHHLRTIENGHMADLFHSAELAVERQDDTFINRLLSHAYELFSDFGSSALRPLLWWLLLFVLTVAIIFHADGAVQAFASDDYYQGWRSSLLDSNTWYADLLRSGYLAFRSMINPLGLFGVRELLAPVTGWLVIYLSFAGLLSVVLITLFVLAVRRRFKMQV